MLLAQCYTNIDKVRTKVRTKYRIFFVNHDTKCQSLINFELNDELVSGPKAINMKKF